MQFKLYYEHKICTAKYVQHYILFILAFWYNSYWTFNVAFVVAAYSATVIQINQPNSSYIYKRQRTDKILYIIQ